MKRLSAFLFLFLMAVAGWAQGLEDWYAVLSQFYGIDKNAGTTTFLSLVIPPGGMYEAMGTAYSAVLKDSGYLEANPAGSAVLKETELSFYHNDWIGDSRLESAVFTIRQGDLGIGLGAKMLYLPFTAIDTWGNRYNNPWSSAEAKGYYSEFVGTANASYTLLLDYYWPTITFGTNLKIAQRTVPDAVAQNQSAIDMMADFGVLTKLSFLKFYPSREKNLAFSAVIKNLGPPVQGDGLPTSLVLGMAYSPYRPLTVSVDGTFPHNLTQPLDLSYIPQLSLGPGDENFSVAFGMNLAMTSWWALQGGLNIEPGLPRLTMGSTLNIEKLTVNVAYTADLMTTLAVPDRLSVEVKLNLGDLGRQELDDRAREYYLTGLEDYSKGELEDAIIQWEKALELVPLYKPAEEMTKLAKDELEARRKLEETQKIQ